MDHPIVLSAREDVRRGKLHTGFNRAVFWSDDPKRYADKSLDNNTELMRAFCRANPEMRPLPKLQLSFPLKRMNDESVPLEIRHKVAEIYSRNYAFKAEGTIYVAVDRSLKNSFFAIHEIPLIKDNEKITHVCRLDRSSADLRGETFEKAEWLSLQNETWSRALAS